MCLARCCRRFRIDKVEALVKSQTTRRGRSGGDLVQRQLSVKQLSWPMLVDVAELQEPWEGQREGFYV
jgi:hypothetical protein